MSRFCLACVYVYANVRPSPILRVRLVRGQQQLRLARLDAVVADDQAAETRERRLPQGWPPFMEEAAAGIAVAEREHETVFAERCVRRSRPYSSRRLCCACRD